MIIGKVIVPLHLMKSKITHSGIVESVSDRLVRVRIVQAAACAACKVAGHCTASESKVKIIDVCTSEWSSYTKGDAVTVSVSESSARKALLVGFGMPFAVMVGVVFITLWLTCNETISALAGLAALIPYYIIVWLFRDRIGGSVTFGIEKLSE